MFDTMTVTKIVGAVCGSLLVFLLISWASDEIYSTEAAHGEHAEAAYTLEVEEVAVAGEAVVEGPSFEELFAAADVAKGKKTFSKCKACHKLDAGANGVGPSLFGVVDRDIATVDGFAYSPAVSGLEGNWTPEQINAFLTKPKTFAPGTKMSFAGLKKATDRVNIIAYLATIK